MRRQGRRRILCDVPERQEEKKVTPEVKVSGEIVHIVL